MRIVELKGDVFHIETDVIVHVVNCKGVMGSGVAAGVKKWHPTVYEAYKKFCETNIRRMYGEILLPNAETSYLLGKVLIVESNGILIANLFAQNEYRGMYEAPYVPYDPKFLNYESLWQSLQKLRKELPDGPLRISFPKNMGSGLAGGSWAIVLPMITETFKDYDVTIQIVEYEKDKE